jgi:hypothetical protein
MKELTEGNYRVYDKQTGEADYHGINMEMIMECVFRGLNKHTDKAETFKDTIISGARAVLSDDNAFEGKELSGKKRENNK